MVTRRFLLALLLLCCAPAAAFRKGSTEGPIVPDPTGPPRPGNGLSIGAARMSGATPNQALNLTRPEGAVNLAETFAGANPWGTAPRSVACFTSATQSAFSVTLAQNALMIGDGGCPAMTPTGAGVLPALAIAPNGVSGGVAGFSNRISVDNYEGLAALPSNTSAAVVRLGYATPGDGPPVVYMPSSSTCSLNDGFGDGGSQVPITAAGGGCWLAQITTVDNRIWGAKNDGVTDDTTADQAAINYALADPANAKTLFIAGPSLVSSSLIVNRYVDKSVNDFVIQGIGKSAGFYVTSAINIFDSSLPFASEPVSERVTFRDITFRASSAALASYEMTPKFLRVTLDHCTHWNIKSVTSNIYLQTWHYIGHNFMRGHSGIFFNTAGAAYDINFDGSEWEGPDVGIVVGTSVGVRLTNNTYESGSEFFAQTHSDSIIISNNYFESNSGVDVNFGSGGSGIVYSGNVHLVTNMSTFFYPVVWGSATGVSMGNYSNKNLHDDTLTYAGSVTSINDTAGKNLFKVGSIFSAALAGAVARSGPVIPYAGGGQANAVLLTAPLNYIYNCGSGGVDSVRLPPSFPASYGFGHQMTVVNYCAHSVQLFATGATDTINFIAGTTGISIPSGSILTFYEIDQGKYVGH